MSPRSLFVTALFAVATLAVPLFRPGGPGPVRTCDPGRASLTVPAPLAAPVGKATGTILGVGTQNYTCTAAGTYASAGAVAQLYDISCLIGTPAFDTVQDTAFKAWTASKDKKSTSAVNRAVPGLKNAGDHYFVVSPSGTGISPIWDQRKCGRANGNEGFVLGAKAAGVAAPTGSQDVDWLQISNVQGNLAKTVYRTDTRGGPPPASCTPGSPVLTVKYTSKYWFFQG